MGRHMQEGVDAIQANARRAAGIPMPRQIRRRDSERRTHVILTEQCHACGCTNAWAIHRERVQIGAPRCEYCGTMRRRIGATLGTTHL